MSRGYSPDLEVRVAGRALPPELTQRLVEATVEDSAAVPDLAVLRFRDPSGTVVTDGGFTMGATIELAVATSGAASRTVVTVVEVVTLARERDTTGTYTVVTGMDASHRLQRGTRQRVFVDMTADAIVSQVAQDAGIPVTIELRGLEVRPHVTQAGISDWSLLRRLADEEGAVLSVVAGTLRFGPVPASAGAPTASPTAVEPRVVNLTADVQTGHAVLSTLPLVASVEVRGWDPAAKTALVAREDATATTEVTAGLTPSTAMGGFPGHHRTLPGSWATSQAVAGNLARATAAQHAAEMAEIRAEVPGSPDLRAGVSIRLDGFGRPFDGTYVLSWTRHIFDPDLGYRTEIGVSGRQDRSLPSVLAGSPASPATQNRLVTGVVTNTKDPDKQGRVKVSLPWLGDDLESTWARTLQYGGIGGGMVVPEIDDEVLVGFEFGDVDRPYVLGGLYNGRDASWQHEVDVVDANDGKVVVRSLASRTGNRLELLEPSSGVRGVRVATGDDSIVVVLDSAGTQLSLRADGTVVVSGTRGIALDAGTGDLTVKAANITMDASAKIDMSGVSGARIAAGPAEMNLATGGSASLKGTAVTVEGQTTAELAGSATTTIRGGIVRIN